MFTFFLRKKIHLKTFTAIMNKTQVGSYRMVHLHLCIEKAQKQITSEDVLSRVNVKCFLIGQLIYFIILKRYLYSTDNIRRALHIVHSH